MMLGVATTKALDFVPILIKGITDHFCTTKSMSIKARVTAIVLFFTGYRIYPYLHYSNSTVWYNCGSTRANIASCKRLKQLNLLVWFSSKKGKCLFIFIPLFQLQWNMLQTSHFNIKERCPSINLGIMMTSSNGNIFRVAGPLCGEFTGPGEFPTQRPRTRSFDVFFDLRRNKPLSKQSWGWWFETLSRSLWRHRNVILLDDVSGDDADGYNVWFSHNSPTTVLTQYRSSTTLKYCQGLYFVLSIHLNAAHINLVYKVSKTYVYSIKQKSVHWLFH